jgi:ATP-dependent helicase HrpA
VRFEDQSDSSTLIKLMTDGILLAETQRPLPGTLRHDHRRRSPRTQPEHRLPARLPENPAAASPGPEVITSATIDLERFSKHFDDAPIVEVSGRTFPVDLVSPADLEQDGGQPRRGRPDRGSGDPRHPRRNRRRAQ